MGTSGPIGHPQLHALVAKFTPFSELPRLRLLSRSCADYTTDFICEDTVEYFMRGDKGCQSGDVSKIAKLFLALRLVNSDRYQSTVIPVLFNELDSSARSEMEAEHRVTMRGNAWIRLGYILSNTSVSDELSITVRGETFTQLQCFQRGLDLNPKNTVAWSIVARWCQGDEGFVYRGKPMTPVECAVQACETSPDNAQGWFFVGYYLHSSPAKTVVIAGKEYTATQAYVKSLEVNEDDSATWHNLGLLSRHGQHVCVKGKHYSELDCFTRLVTLRPSSQAWLLLASSLVADHEAAVIHGKKYDRVDCLIRAAEMDEEGQKGKFFSQSLGILAGVLQKGRTVSIAGVVWRMGDHKLEPLE